MSYQTIELQSTNGVAWVTLNRPEFLNAITTQMVGEIHSALDEIQDDAEIRVLVFTGRGRAFCAGADLKGSAGESAAGQEKPRLPFIELVQKLFLRVRVLPKPVIAAINGIAMAGGLELAMNCDIVVAADDAKIADAHANVGVIPGAGGCAILPRLIGPAYTKYLVFSGESVLAPELHRLGLIAKLFPRNKLIEGASALAERIAEKSPLGLSYMKRLINEGMEQANVATALGMELTANAAYGHSYDFNEGVAAFNERRKPQFRGC